LLTIPAREPAERREPEERGHFREIAVRIIEEDCGELASDAGHDLRERLAFLRKASVNGAPIDAEVLRDNLDTACSAADKAHNQLSDLYRELVGPLLWIRIQHLASKAREPWIGRGIRDIEIPARTDDAGKCLTELDPASDQPVVFCAIGGGIV
jgi:hypothetical protein